MGDTWPPGHIPYSLNLEHEVSLQWFLCLSQNLL